MKFGRENTHSHPEPNVSKPGKVENFVSQKVNIIDTYMTYHKDSLGIVGRFVSEARRHD